MHDFKHILVPIDFSEHSREAIRTAADLAQRYGAKLTIAHVFEPIAYALPEGYTLYTPNQVADLLTEFTKQLDAAKREALAEGAEHVETVQLQGIIAPELAEFAKLKGVSLIVMGTHGRKGLKHALLGSVAERILRTAPCPVLVVKAESAD